MKPLRSTQKPKVLAPKGSHDFRFQGIVDLGTQPSAPGYSYDPQRKVLFMMELVRTNHVFDEAKGPQPFVAKNELGFVLSSYNGKRSNLLKFLDNLKGEILTDQQMDEVDLKKLLNWGGKCMIAHVEKKDKSFRESVANVFPLTKEEMKAVPPLRNPLMYFSIEEPKKEEWDKLHDWIKKKIRESHEWPKIKDIVEPSSANQSQGENVASGTDDDQDPPF